MNIDNGMGETLMRIRNMGITKNMLAEKFCISSSTVKRWYAKLEYPMWAHDELVKIVSTKGASL